LVILFAKGHSQVRPAETVRSRTSFPFSLCVNCPTCPLWCSLPFRYSSVHFLVSVVGLTCSREFCVYGCPLGSALALAPPRCLGFPLPCTFIIHSRPRFVKRFFENLLGFMFLVVSPFATPGDFRFYPIRPLSAVP